MCVVVTASWLVYGPTGLAALWHVTVVQQTHKVAKPVRLEKKGKLKEGTGRGSG